MGQVRTIMSWDALYYYYKPDYLNLVADTTARTGPYTTTPMDGEQIVGKCLVRRVVIKILRL